MALEPYRKAVVLANLGTIRSAEGHEQALTRPCLVIKPLNILKLVIVLPLSTSPPPKSAGKRVKIDKGTAHLKKDSFVLIHQIRTISTQRIMHEIGKLPSPKFKEIQRVLKNFLIL